MPRSKLINAWASFINVNFICNLLPTHGHDKQLVYSGYQKIVHLTPYTSPPPTPVLLSFWKKISFTFIGYVVTWSLIAVLCFYCGFGRCQRKSLLYTSAYLLPTTCTWEAKLTHVREETAFLGFLLEPANPPASSHALPSNSSLHASNRATCIHSRHGSAFYISPESSHTTDAPVTVGKLWTPKRISRTSWNTK